MEIKLSPELTSYGLPQYATAGSVAVDLRAFWTDGDQGKFSYTNGVAVDPGRRFTFNTGLSLDMRGYYLGQPCRLGAEIHSRSGLGTKGLVLANGVGVIDEDYTSELKVTLLNTSGKPFRVLRGDRIAQLKFVRVPILTFTVVKEFSRGQSGRGGFGSTGVA
jgi:dUTP pyrophosphatase